MMAEHLAEWYDECIIAYAVARHPRWTQARKRKAVELVLRSQGHRSDRAIARETGFSRELIARHRRRLVAQGRIPAGLRTGLDGKRYKIGVNNGDA